jgi:hypothetical protein
MKGEKVFSHHYRYLFIQVQGIANLLQPQSKVSIRQVSINYQLCSTVEYLCNAQHHCQEWVRLGGVRPTLEDRIS